MQTTPFKHVNYHEDGRHIFTVEVSGEIKRFVTTENITPQKALLNAINWRNHALKAKLSSIEQVREELQIESFVSEILTPFQPTVKKAPTPRQILVPEHVKVQHIPNGQSGVQEGGYGHRSPVKRDYLPKVEPVVVEGTPLNLVRLKPKKVTAVVTDKIRRQKKLKKLVDARNSSFPFLPAGITPEWNKSPDRDNESLSIRVVITVGGKRKVKKFYVSRRDSFTLAKYRAVRFVAITLRHTWIQAQANGEDVDMTQFNNALGKMRDGTFIRPYTGTLPEEGILTAGAKNFNKDPEATARRLSESRKVLQREGINRRWPFLPRGVTPLIQHTTGAKGRTPQVHMSVHAPVNGKKKQRSFYISTDNGFTLAKYRIARHVAICWRKECLAAEDENRAVDNEAFEDWKTKIREGTFKWPFKGTVPDDFLVRKYKQTDSRHLGVAESRKAGYDIIRLLKQHLALGSAMSVLDLDDQDALATQMSEIILQHGYL